MPARNVAVVAALLAFVLTACAGEQVTAQRRDSAPPATPQPAEPAKTLPPPPPTRPANPDPERESRPTAAPDPKLPGPRMVQATMRIPAIGLGTVRVVAYRGSPDDAPGTLIQNGGVAASPFGPRGGVGPGQVGNYIVTAHRTTVPAPFADLPALDRGEHVLVTARGKVLDYRIVGTRSTSFRSPASLARQSAAVPGHPGRRATRPMVTLSTCATPEDHARGNYWADEFGNPEHRIDKIGVLVDIRPG